jgi:hypothetical protein
MQYAELSTFYLLEYIAHRRRHCDSENKDILRFSRIYIYTASVSMKILFLEFRLSDYACMCARKRLNGWTDVLAFSVQEFSLLG